MVPGARDRRPLFGGPSSSSQADSKLDVESLEQENDKSIDALGDRVGLLKKLTSNIKSEVNSQHRVVDGLSDAMGGAQIGLAAASARFKRVFEDPRRNRTFVIAGVAVVILFALYLLITRR